MTYLLSLPIRIYKYYLSVLWSEQARATRVKISIPESFRSYAQKGKWQQTRVLRCRVLGLGVECFKKSAILTSRMTNLQRLAPTSTQTCEQRNTHKSAEKALIEDIKCLIIILIVLTVS